MIISAPQGIFLNDLNTKFRSYVGGFGCVHPDTKIWTEFGLMRISDISDSIRVVSWNEKTQKFQLSLSGGSFPKGRENLFRVSTSKGEFVSSGHHRVFSSLHRYLRVDEIFDRNGSDSSFQSLACSNLEFGRLLSSLDVQNYSKKDEDYLTSYANEARRYGQQFLLDRDNDLTSIPSSTYAQEFGLFADPFSSLQMDDSLALIREHNHHGLLFFRHYMRRSDFLLRRLVLSLVNPIVSWFFERTSRIRSRFRRSLSKVFSHRKGLLSSFVFGSSDAVSQASVNSVSVVECSPYYDIQVLDTNNYVCENGFIHHNSGKTFVGCVDLLTFASRYPKVNQGYFSISYPAIRDIFYPTLEECAHMMGFRIRVNKSEKAVSLFRGGFYYGTIICRSMDDPSTIIGFKVARALVDEIDVLDKAKAQQAWDKIIARLRLKVDGVVNGIGVTTTPEGFKFVYSKFKENPTESYSMVQASTYENYKYLPDDYIDSLRESYSPQLADAYIEGEFVNLTAGTVYKDFDRKLNHSDEVESRGEHLFVGMDFNVQKMSAIIHVKRDGKPVAVNEFTGVYDTPAMIDLIKERYPEHRISVYPDASGQARKTVNASISDLSLLKQAGFSVVSNSKNPSIKSRITCMNSNFCNMKGERNYKVNTTRCPEYTKCLEQQAYDDNGQPDKKQDLDHAPDAGGYFIVKDYPILKPVARPIFRRG